MDAEDLLLRQFLGIRGDDDTAEAARWIRSQQRPDGTWANFFEGPADLSTTIESYVALRLAGDAADAEHMRRAGLLHPGVRRHRGQPGVHADLAGAVRPVVLGRPAGDAAGDDLPAEVVPAQRLRLGLLGPADRGAADRRRGAAPGAAAGRGARRAAHRRDRAAAAPGFVHRRWTAPCTSTRSARCPPCGGRAAPLRGVDHRAPGARRLLGRDPAAVGVLADRAQPARLRRRPPGHEARASKASSASRSATTPAAAWRRASPRCGTRCWR